MVKVIGHGIEVWWRKPHMPAAQEVHARRHRHNGFSLAFCGESWSVVELMRVGWKMYKLGIQGVVVSGAKLLGSCSVDPWGNHPVALAQ